MENRSMKKRIARLMINNKALILAISLGVLLAIVAGKKFFSMFNILNVIRQNSIMAILAIGFTTILASGFFDLSIGYMLGTIGVVCAMLLKTDGMPVFAALFITILFGAFIGFLNSLFIDKFDLPPFIVTLSTGQILKGTTFLLCNGTSIGGLPPALITIGQGYFLGIPIPIFVMFIVAAVVAIIMNSTPIGRHIIAVGGNREASRVCGISIGKVQYFVYILMGICVSIAAILMDGRTASAQPNAGTGMEMDAIGAVVIGGTPLTGGSGNVVGSVFGCLIVGLINNGLNLLNVNSYWQWVAKGAIILIAMMLDRKTTKLLDKLH